MSPQHPNGVIAWFAYNPVAANLLMLIIMIVGLGSAFTIQRAMFPTIEINSTFYRPPAIKTTQAWAERVQPFDGFRFTKLLTNHLHRHTRFEVLDRKRGRTGEADEQTGN